MILFLIGLYYVIGLCCAYYSTSFLKVDYSGKYRGITDPIDYVILCYFYLTIPFLWAFFAIALSLINIFDKTIARDLHKDFLGVMNFKFGYLENPIERW